MAKIYKGIQELIGNTPLVEAVNLEKKLGLKATLLLKLEYFNPAGSVKDRIANGMIEDAEKKGLLKEGATIIAVSYTNLAIGRAIVKNPDILLCDEPTGALDYNTSKDILRLIETVNQK